MSVSAILVDYYDLLKLAHLKTSYWQLAVLLTEFDQLLLSQVHVELQLAATVVIVVIVLV